MQDNASAHKHIADELSKNLPAELMEKFLLVGWPARSPDLIPIETIWSWLEQHKRRHPGGFKDTESLAAGFQDFISKNKATLMKNVHANIVSLYERMLSVVDVGGGSETLSNHFN